MEYEPVTICYQKGSSPKNYELRVGIQIQGKQFRLFVSKSHKVADGLEPGGGVDIAHHRKAGIPGQQGLDVLLVHLVSHGTAGLGMAQDHGLFRGQDLAGLGHEPDAAYLLL